MRSSRFVSVCTGLAVAITVAGCAAVALEQGQRAPDFTATDTDGRAIHLAELVKDHTVVVAFFPKAFTPG